jgi:transcriptional regulator with XRE-family HTH domain
MSTLGSRLRYAREKKGWTQTYVCRKLGISNSTLSGYEREYREPDADMISTFAEIYEVSPGWLLTGRTDDPPSVEKKDQTHEIDDPSLNIFFKDFVSAPDEKRRQLMDIWEVIKRDQATRKPGDKQGE